MRYMLSRRLWPPHTGAKHEPQPARYRRQAAESGVTDSGLQRVAVLLRYDALGRPSLCAVTMKKKMRGSGQNTL